MLHGGAKTREQGSYFSAPVMPEDKILGCFKPGVTYLRYLRYLRDLQTSAYNVRYLAVHTVSKAELTYWKSSVGRLIGDLFVPTQGIHWFCSVIAIASGHESFGC